MTNADTPAIATEGIIEDAKNPFTGLAYKVPDKSDYVKISLPDAESTRKRMNKKYTIPNDVWWTVSGEITKGENWQQIYPFGK